jgi:hypothetical protein
MPDESEDITIKAPEYAAETHTGGVPQDITPQSSRAGTVKEDLQAEIARIEAEQARERATQEEPGWQAIIGREGFKVATAPDLSFLSDLADTMGGRATGGFDIGASAAGEKIASVITWIGNERTRLNNAISGRMSANVQRSNVLSQSPGTRGAAGEQLTPEEAKAASDKAYQSTYEAERQLRQAETARKYGIPIEEAANVVVYMGDWEGGPTAKWMYTGATSPPGVPAEGLPGNPYDVGSWSLKEEPLPDNPVASDIQELAGYLETINPKGKSDTYDVRAAAMNSGRRVATYRERIEKKLAEGKYPEEYKTSVENYLTGAETYETSVFQWAGAPSKQNYWAMKMQEQNPELPPSLTWAISRAMFPEEGGPSTAATDIFQWATGKRTTFGKNQAAPGGVDLAAWAKENGQAPPEGGIRGDLLPASFPEFAKETGKASGDILTENKILGWANQYTNKAVGVMGEAANFKRAESPTPPSPAEAEAAGILGVETLPKAGPHERASFDEYITAMPVRGAMKEIEWIKAGEAGWLNSVNSGIGWIPGESAPKEFLRQLSTLGVGAVAGTGMAVLATWPLAAGAGEYFLREPGEAFGNIVPGLGMQAEQTAAAFEENPALTTGEIVGPFLLPWAVKKVSPITIGFTDIPTGRETPTVWSRLGIGAREFTPPWSRSFANVEGEVVSQGWGTGDSVKFFEQTKPETSTYLYLMTKSPGSPASEGGTVIAGIGRGINAASGESRIRPFLGHPTDLMESSTVSIREGRVPEAGVSPWTRGETALMEPLKAARATPADLTVSRLPGLMDQAEAMRVQPRQAQPIGSIPHEAMTATEEAGIQRVLSEQGRGAVQPGSRVAAAWLGEENFPRDVRSSDIDVDLTRKASPQVFKGIREVMEASREPVGETAWEPLRGREAEAVVLSGTSRKGESVMHLKEVGAPKELTSKIVGTGEIEGRPWISRGAVEMESTGGPVRGVGPAGMAKSYYSRTFQSATWEYSPEGGLEFKPNLGETKNIPDLAAMSRYLARAAYEAPADLTVDVAGVRAGRRLALGAALEDFSTVFQEKYGSAGVEHVRPGYRDTLLAGVNRETPGPSITRAISEATGRPSRTSGVVDTMGLYGGAAEAGRAVAGAYARGLPGEPEPALMAPPYPRMGTKAETYPLPARPSGYQRTGEYTRERGYPKSPEYPRAPEYPQERGYQRTFESLYPREPGYPRTTERVYPREPTYPQEPEPLYPREPTYPRTPETPYPREPGYPRTPEAPYPRNPPPPRVPRTPPPPILPGKERQERHPRPLSIVGYGEITHPIYEGAVFLGLKRASPLPKVREWHPTRAQGAVTPQLAATLARSRATAPWVKVGGHPKFAHLATPVFRRGFWRRGPKA